MSFCFWDLYEYSLLQNTTKYSWAIKTATAGKTAICYLCFADWSKEYRVSIFFRPVRCQCSTIVIWLISKLWVLFVRWPNVDIGKNRCAILFDMYTRFRKAYYGYDCYETLLTVATFLTNGPFVVIDCTQQNEFIKSAIVDVRIEFDCKKNVPANTTYCCLILHDRVIEYCP